MSKKKVPTAFKLGHPASVGNFGRYETKMEDLPRVSKKDIKEMIKKHNDRDIVKDTIKELDQLQMELKIKMSEIYNISDNIQRLATILKDTHA